MYLLEKARQAGKDSGPHFEHVLPELRQVVNEISGCARVEAIVETGDALGHVAVRKIREGNIPLVNGDGFAQRFDAVDDVAMAQTRALGISRSARRVDHDRRIILMRLFGALPEKSRDML